MKKKASVGGGVVSKKGGIGLGFRGLYPKPYWIFVKR
jgi:hypothetical protein